MPKKRLFDKILFITTLVCLLPLIFSAIVYKDLPDTVAIHFNASGNPDNYASKAVAAFLLPLGLALINVVMHLLLNADPKRDDRQRLRNLSKWIICIVSMLVNPMTLLFALGKDIRIERIIPLFIALLFLVIGNYLPKCRQNYTVGIKLPWTLASEDNWNKTHRFAGWVWTILSIVQLTLLLVMPANLIIFFTLVALMAGLPILYSFILYTRFSTEDTE